MGLVAWVIVHGILAPFSLESLSAQEAFAPPSAYPIDRYEKGWRKNPFTIRTAPVVVEQVSFARDLAIAGCFGTEDDPSVVVVNTRTHERTRIKKGERASNGMILNSVTFTSSRKETMAEVTLDGATAVLRFDESYVKQFAAKQRSRVTMGQKASASAGSLASGPEPVASTPKDQGSGYPYAYGNPEERTTTGLVEGGSAQGRRRLLTAQKPLVLRK
jgi:hypothetical protein